MSLVEPVMGLTGIRVPHPDLILRALLFNLKLTFTLLTLIDVFVVLASKFLPITYIHKKG